MHWRKTAAVALVVLGKWKVYGNAFFVYHCIVVSKEVVEMNGTSSLPKIMIKRYLLINSQSFFEKYIETVKGAEYAISMRGSYQEKRIAFWTTVEVLRIAFEKLKLHRVYLNVLADNENTCRFYTKKRFGYEGESRSCIQVGGRLDL